MRLVSDNTIATITIFQEAEGEPYEGKCAVGEVIRRRMGELKSATDVCLQAYQFSGWNTSSENRVRSVKADPSVNPPVAECIKAWGESAISNFSNGATHYANIAIAGIPYWAKDMDIVATIGKHTFFKEKGSTV